MVQPQQCHTQCKTCTWVPQCDSGRPLKEESDPKHRMVPVSTSFQTNFQDMGESPSGPFCNQTEHKTPLICLSDPGSSGLGCRRPEHSMGEAGCLRLSPNRATALLWGLNTRSPYPLRWGVKTRSPFPLP